MFDTWLVEKVMQTFSTNHRVYFIKSYATHVYFSFQIKILLFGGKSPIPLDSRAFIEDLTKKRSDCFLNRLCYLINFPAVKKRIHSRV